MPGRKRRIAREAKKAAYKRFDVDAILRDKEDNYPDPVYGWIGDLPEYDDTENPIDPKYIIKDPK